MKKCELKASLLSFADCKSAFMTDAQRLASVATDNVIVSINDDDDNNVHSLYIGNCTLNKKSVKHAATILNIPNVNVSATKKHHLTISFEGVTMRFNPDTYIIDECVNDDAKALANSLAAMFYYTK